VGHQLLRKVSSPSYMWATNCFEKFLYLLQCFVYPFALTTHPLNPSALDQAVSASPRGSPRVIRTSPVWVTKCRNQLDGHTPAQPLTGRSLPLPFPTLTTASCKDEKPSDRVTLTENARTLVERVLSSDYTRVKAHGPTSHQIGSVKLVTNGGALYLLWKFQDPWPRSLFQEMHADSWRMRGLVLCWVVVKRRVWFHLPCGCGGRACSN
jgi:hypothetical protein